MSDNKNENVVIALMPTPPQMKRKRRSMPSRVGIRPVTMLKLGAIGTMVVTPEGKIKTHVGRKAGKGAKVGAIVGVIAGVFTGGATVARGLVAGSVVGGVLGRVLQEVHKLDRGRAQQDRRRAQERQGRRGGHL